MDFCSVLSWIVVLSAVCLYNTCQAQTACATSGWFGPNCLYQCHCAGSSDCDKVDGSCSSGCHSDWFGPACQYARMSFTDVSSLWWLADTNDRTCNTGSTQSVTVTLDTPIPITWVRVVVSNAVNLNQFTLTYHTSFWSQSLTCPDPGTAQVDDTTLDIRCSTTDIAQRLSLSGTGVQVLCSLYINAGRNVALKQTAEQSSRYSPSSIPSDSYVASYAVDGGTEVQTNITGTRSTCTHTDPNVDTDPGWWTVTFSQPVDITWFLIYNRNDNNNVGYRLAKFRLTVQPESSSSATAYTYPEPDTVGQATYTVVPRPSDINFPVSQVRFDSGHASKILTLCEVFVYGETSCPPGQFGLRCERQCNCANGGGCFVHSGGCPSGCAPGFTGEDCSESVCPAGSYGSGCSKTCSVNCAGDKNPCNPNDGACSLGCDPGYTGTVCQIECSTGRYGAGCRETCSPNCKGSDNTCSHVDGTCTNGCEDGYRGDKCDLVCGPGKYGAGCGQTCSVQCLGTGDPCDHITGHCTNGCDPGYKGDKCDQECPAGSYGSDCSSRCSDNCAGPDNSCDHIDGTCDAGCDVGFYLDRCTSPCNSGCAGLDNACDRVSGSCTGGCDPGYYGSTCPTKCNSNCGGSPTTCERDTGYCNGGCKPGYYGDMCYNRCSSFCVGSPKTCDRVNGACDQCNPGFYGRFCSDQCNVNCAGPDNTCSGVNGVCDTGCDPGYWGDTCSYSCNSNCGGLDKTCDRGTGACESCNPGYYGADCSKLCSRSCGGSDHACDPSTGDCNTCDPGYTGTACVDKCYNETYGEGCGETCSEHCAGDQNSCHHVNGTCDLGCDPGYQGSNCTQECEAYRWGQDCRKNCSNGCQDVDCDHVTGHCVCLLGYGGERCDQECNATTYGRDCSQTCSTNCLDQLCDRMTGECDSCLDGRTGDYCDATAGEQTGEGGGGSGDSILPIVIGAAVAVVVVVLIVAAVLLLRRRGNQSRGKEEAESGVNVNGERGGSHYADITADTGTGRTRVSAVKPRGDYDESSEEEDNVDKSPKVDVNTGNTAVPVETLKTYILQHAADSHFVDEFSSVAMENESPKSSGLSPKNIKKNRYKNIIPYDFSRVLLQANEAKKQSDYINASYVKGFNKDRQFIASQGPNALILNDFVRMLWEQRVDRVVMLTNLIEDGKIKCTQYWPKDGQEEHGEITVELLTTHVFAEYTIRHLHLSKAGEPARDVTQFHFTAWPDKSVPESPWGLVDLHQRVMSVPGSGPILVHCSAGVGRTGTFIALCNLLQEAEVTGKMDFRSTLWELRKDRMHTIQTVAQYIFLHNAALVGHVTAGTTIQVVDIEQRLTSLENGTGGNKSARSYKQEFEALIEVCGATTAKQVEPAEQDVDNVYQNTGAVVDKRRNRLSNILPNRPFRPVLTANASQDSTYINAVLVPNLTKDSQDILTQVPMPSTVTDFWRLVTQYNVGLVVAFDTDSSQGDETIGEFLPKSETEPFENERYLVETKPPTDSTLATEFSLTVHQKVVPGMDTSATQGRKALTFLQCRNTNLDPESVLELQEKIFRFKPSASSRVVFMCRNGADQCGLMCVLSILSDRLETDQCLAVPLVVGTIKAIRPQVIPTVEQYRCLYRVLRLSHQNQNVYGNVGRSRTSSLA